MITYLKSMSLVDALMGVCFLVMFGVCLVLWACFFMRAVDTSVWSVGELVPMVGYTCGLVVMSRIARRS